jgi:hypothetical protein
LILVKKISKIACEKKFAKSFLRVQCSGSILVCFGK